MQSYQCLIKIKRVSSYLYWFKDLFSLSHWSVAFQPSAKRTTPVYLTLVILCSGWLVHLLSASGIHNPICRTVKNYKRENISLDIHIPLCNSKGRIPHTNISVLTYADKFPPMGKNRTHNLLLNPLVKATLKSSRFYPLTSKFSSIAFCSKGSKKEKQREGKIKRGRAASARYPSFLISFFTYRQRVFFVATHEEMHRISPTQWRFFCRTAALDLTTS